MASLARFIALVLVLGAAAGLLLQGPVHAASMATASPAQHHLHAGIDCDGKTDHSLAADHSHHGGHGHSADTMPCVSACLWSAVMSEGAVAITATRQSFADVASPAPAGVTVPGLRRPPRGI